MLKDAGVEPSKIKMLENGEMAEGEWFPLIYWGYVGFAAGFAGTIYAGTH